MSTGANNPRAIEMLGALFLIIKKEKKNRLLVIPILKGPKLKLASIKNIYKSLPYNFLDIINRIISIYTPIPTKAKKGYKAKVYLSITKKKKRKAIGIIKDIIT